MKIFKPFYCLFKSFLIISFFFFYCRRDFLLFNKFFFRNQIMYNKKRKKYFQRLTVTIVFTKFNFCNMYIFFFSKRGKILTRKQKLHNWTLSSSFSIFNTFSTSKTIFFNEFKQSFSFYNK